MDEAFTQDWGHKISTTFLEFLEERMDPDFSLLEKLFNEGVLSRKEIDEVKVQPTYRMGNLKIIEYISLAPKNARDKFITALRGASQSHLANYLTENRVVASLAGEDIDEEEERMATSFANQIGNRSLKASNRILERTRLKIIAAKRGQKCFKLRALCDFNSDEMSHTQKSELEDILKTLKTSMKNKGNTITEKIFSVKRGQQEDKWQNILYEEKGNVGGKMKDGVQNTREEDKQKLKRKAEMIKDDDVMEGGLENLIEVTPSTSFQREHKRLKFTDFLRVGEKIETEAQILQTQTEAPMSNLEDAESSLEDSTTESEYSESSSQKSDIDELLNLKTMALSFRKGDQMETIPPTDNGEVISWWKVHTIKGGKIGYIPKNLVVIDYELDLNQRYKSLAESSQAANLKEVTLKTSMNSLPFELLDSILLKSYLESVLREKQLLKNKDFDAISQLASVDCCWFHRITRRKFKKEVWRSLVGFYIQQEKATSVCRINRQYLDDNIQLQFLIYRLKSNDCLTDVQTVSLYRQNLPLGKKNSYKRFGDSISELVKNTQDCVFRQCLCDTKQHLIGKVVDYGGAMTKVEINLQNAKPSAITRLQNWQIVERIKEIRDKTKIPRSQQIVELVSKLKEDDLEILSAGQDGEVIVVWIWCKTKYGLERLQTMNKSKHFIDVFSELIKNLSFSSEEKNPAMIKPKVNIDYEQFEKTVVFFAIVATFTSTLDLMRRAGDEEVWGVTKLRNKIHVLLSCSSSPCCVILVFEDQFPFSLQTRIEIKEIEYPRDIASIEMENSLYVLDLSKRRKCVWKIEEGYEKEKKIIKWLELEEYCDRVPWTLSTTKDGLLLLVIQRMHDPFWSLWIFGEGESKEANLHLSIPLSEDIQDPWQTSLEASKGNFIIPHKIKRKKEQQSALNGGKKQTVVEMEEEMKVVSEVSGDGKTILRRFIPKNEEQKLGPGFGRVVVDSFGRVFLADNEKDRIILFDSDLQWNGILIPRPEDGEKRKGVWWPRRLFYDEEKKELIVVGEEVSIYTVNRK